MQEIGGVGSQGWRKMKIKDNKGWEKKLEELLAAGVTAVGGASCTSFAAAGVWAKLISVVRLLITV